MLGASAIDAGVAFERPYTRVAEDDPRLADFAAYQRRPGILLAIRPPDGSNGLYKLRPDAPRVHLDPKTGKRKETKYEGAAGQPLRLDVHPRNLGAIKDASRPLWITEGVKKADALTSAGRVAVALDGVWCFKTEQLLADWDLIETRGRTCIIAFDSDAATNENVAKAEDALAALLQERGAARVLIVRIPAAADGSKQGVDDYLGGGGDLVDLLAKHAEEWRPPEERGRCPRPDCRATREALHVQTQIAVTPGLRANRRLPAFALINRVLSDSVQVRHPDAEPGKPETWAREEPIADADGYVAIPLQKMAKETGIPYSSLLNVRKELVGIGVFEAREKVEIVTKGGRSFEVAQTLLRPARDLRTPREIVEKLATVVQAPSNWGGRRVKRCPDHPDAAIVTKHLCSVCGAEAETVELPPEPDPATDFKVETDPAPRSGVKPAQPPPSHFKVETGAGDAPPPPPRTNGADLENGSTEPLSATDFKLETGPPGDGGDAERAAAKALGRSAYDAARKLAPPFPQLMAEDGTTVLVKGGEWSWAAVRASPPPNIAAIAARVRRWLERHEADYRF